MNDPQPPIGEPASSGKPVLLSAGVLAALVLAAGLLTLPRYGITSDEPVIYYGGEWQLWALGSDHPNRWDFRRDPAPLDFEKQTHFNRHPDGNGHYVFPGFPGFFTALVAQAARHVPGYTLLDAFHAGIVLLHALVVFALTVYLGRLIGLRRALFVAILYALYPSAVGHSHYNVKDWPMVGFYALTMVSFACGLLEARPRFLLQSGFWLGLGLCSKANLVFAGPTVAVWTAIAWLTLYRGQRRIPGALVAAGLSIPLVAAVTFWAAWPYLRAGSPAQQWAKFQEALAFIVDRGRSGRAGFSPYPFFIMATMTPPVELLGLLLAAVLPFRGGRREVAIASLAWLWLLVPLGRIALPHSNYYDANRHFLEYVPALALLAGLGLDAGATGLARWLERLRQGWGARARGAVLAAVVGLAAWPVVEYHPFESTYHNAFIGGLGGAQRLRLSHALCRDMEFWCPDFEGDYWGFSLREAVKVVNRVARPGDKLAPCGNLIRPLMKWSDLRPGIPTVDRHQADLFILIPRRPFCSQDEQDYIHDHAEPIVEERRGGGLVFGVYRRVR